MKIIFATNNKNKMKEVREILSDSRFEIVSLKEEGIISDVEETGTTFEENAILKAKDLAERTGNLVLADDSGLEVDFINKEPGVYSARYMGEETSYIIKNNNIIERLSDAEGSERSARFVCAIAAAFPNGDVITTRGTIEGEITHKIKGENGFGYDPIVFIKEKGRTLAELSSEEKNEISHRGKALRKMKKLLEEKLTDKEK